MPRRPSLTPLNAHRPPRRGFLAIQRGHRYRHPPGLRCGLSSFSVRDPMVGHASTDGTMMDGLGFGFCSHGSPACPLLPSTYHRGGGSRDPVCVSAHTGGQAAKEPSPQGGEMLPTALSETRVQCGGGTPANAFSTAIPSPDVYRRSSACQTQPAAAQVPNRLVVHSPHPWLQAQQSWRRLSWFRRPAAGIMVPELRGQSLLSRRRG